MDKENVPKRNFGNLADSDGHEVESQILKKVRCLEEQNENEVNGKKINSMTELLEDMNCVFDDDNFGLNLDELNNAEQFTLDLANWKRCRIISVQNDIRMVTLIVESITDKTKAKCVLEQPWLSLQLKESDIVSVKGAFDRSNNLYRINNEDGMIVTDPDYLVSGTSVVGALYCQRRGVLQERFRGVEADNKTMTIGTIVHELLQRTLRNELIEMVDIVDAGSELLSSKNMAQTLFACKMSREEAEKEVEPFYSRIHDFIKNHVQLSSEKTTPINTDIQIFAINDIEENIWCHQLGLKGKIDLTVDAKCSNDQQRQLMPLELKTGRASFSAEHKGQVVLYEMMMNIIGHHVDKGILLYLREGKCASVSGNRNMKRDLIMLRNEVAHYLSRGLPNTDSLQFDLERDILELPEPLNNHHTCSRCPYSTICTTYLQHEKRDLPENHSIKLIAAESLNHLNDGHINYFIRWAGLIFLEDEEARKGFSIKHLWTKSPEKRHEVGRAAINLRLSGRVIKSVDEYFHTFTFDNNLNDSLCSSKLPTTKCMFSFFEINEYLICSTSKRIAVAAGRVTGIEKLEITISLERDLSQRYGKESFHLDKYESKTWMTFNLTNVGALLENTERSERLRHNIIDRNKPTFARTLPAAIVSEANEILQNLNKHQKIAVLTAVGTNTYCLFKGLPGTGKTQTVIALVRMLVAMNKSILITSNTHSAVDNVLRRLLPYNIKFMRLGATSRIDSALKDFSEANLTRNCSTPEELAAVYNSYHIVGVTCLGSAHPMLAQKKFDFCIVDEATQVFQSAVIRPLLFSEKFVLIGDPDQLSPVVKSRKAKDLGADESLFYRLDTEQQSCCVLPTQYRMNRTITKLANDFCYKGNLLCATEEVANSKITLPQVQSMQRKHKKEKWFLRTTASQLELSVVLINTLNTFNSSIIYDTKRKRDKSYIAMDSGAEPKAIYENYCEAAIVFYTIMALLEAGIDGSSIGVIAPFRAQVDLLRYYLKLIQKKYGNQETTTFNNLDIEINTVDQYQGKDKDIIFYSCTKSNNPKLIGTEKATAYEYEILEDHKRLTVAITRAKKKLIILGDIQCLEKYTPFQNLFKCISSTGKITLQGHSVGFEWSNVFNSLDILHDSEK